MADKVLVDYTGTEKEIIQQVKQALAAKGAAALIGHQFCWDGGKPAAEIAEASWTGHPVLKVQSFAAGRTLEGEITGASVIGRTLWGSDRIGHGAALKVELKITWTEGETHETWKGWIW